MQPKYRWDLGRKHRWRGRFSHRSTHAMLLRLRIQMNHVLHKSQMRQNVTRTFFLWLMCHVEHEGLRCGSPFFVSQGWQRIQSSELRSRRYRAGLKNQMISRVVNQASKTPRAIETKASTTGIKRTSDGAGSPQYGVLIKGWRATVNGQSRTGSSLSLEASN